MKNYFVLTTIILYGSLFAPETQTLSHIEYSKKRNTPGYPGPVGTVSIIIDKSDYELSVFDDKGWYATYPVVFGNNSLADKKMQGDNNTPEGDFKIISKRVHSKWCRFLAIDYPNEVSREKFQRRKSKGEIPANASIGGGIGIHGTWPHEDFVVDKYKNWTEGCISMKNEHVKEIYQFITIGTKVMIRK